MNRKVVSHENSMGEVLQARFVIESSAFHLKSDQINAPTKRYEHIPILGTGPEVSTRRTLHRNRRTGAVLRRCRVTRPTRWTHASALFAAENSFSGFFLTRVDARPRVWSAVQRGAPAPFEECAGAGLQNFEP
jgi:hypothetical protein